MMPDPEWEVKEAQQVVFKWQEFQKPISEESQVALIEKIRQALLSAEARGFNAGVEASAKKVEGYISDCSAKDRELIMGNPNSVLQYVADCVRSLRRPRDEKP